MHHVREEENDLFDELCRVPADWDGLLQDLRERQQQLRAEYGVAEPPHETEMETTVHPAARTSATGTARASKTR
jgi:hypothetical protein